MSDLTERLEGAALRYGDRLYREAKDRIAELEATVKARIADLLAADERIAELDWLVAYVIRGLDDWSDGRVLNSVFFTEAATKRVRTLAGKGDGNT